MLDKIMTALGFVPTQDEEDDFSSRRVYPRRHNDKCVGVVSGTTMPVLDWSPGGVRVMSDTRTVQLGEEMDVVLKFQLKDEMIKVSHRAQVVRKARDDFALKFLPLPADIKQTFNLIIDNFNADEFAASQA